LLKDLLHLPLVPAAGQDAGRGPGVSEPQVFKRFRNQRLTPGKAWEFIAPVKDNKVSRIIIPKTLPQISIVNRDTGDGMSLVTQGFLKLTDLQCLPISAGSQVIVVKQQHRRVCVSRPIPYLPFIQNHSKLLALATTALCLRQCQFTIKESPSKGRTDSPSADLPLSGKNLAYLRSFRSIFGAIGSVFEVFIGSMKVFLEKSSRGCETSMGDLFLSDQSGFPLTA
jgi:hypothetical protein